MVMGQAVRQPQISWKMLLLTAFVAVQMAMAPVRQAQAAIPVLLAGLGLFIKTPLGKSAMASLALHVAVLAVEFHNTSSAIPPSSNSEKKLEVKLNPKDPMATPVGWAGASGGNPEPTPPAAGTPSQAYTWTGPTYANYRDVYQSPPQTFGANVSGGITTYCSTRGGVKTSGSWVWSPSSGLGQYITNYECVTGGASVIGSLDGVSCPSGFQVIADQAHTPGNQCRSTTMQTTCPVGYTVSGSTCTLTDAAVVQKPPDGVAEIKRAGNVLYTDARDTADGLPPGVTVESDKVTAVSKDGLKTVTTTIAADGTTKIVSTTARNDGSGKTDQETVNISAPNATTGEVEVLGTSAKVLAGTGTEASTVPDSGGTSDAKDATLHAIKSSIDEIKTAGAADRAAAEALDATSSTVKNQVPESAWTIAGVSLPNQNAYTVASLTGVGDLLPSNDSGQCVTLDVALPVLGAMAINPCPVVKKVAPLVDWMVRVLAVLAAYFIWFGKKES